MSTSAAPNKHPPVPGSNAVHLCIDMQRLFGADGIWPTPWMPRVLPVVAALVQHCPQRTVFTRFIPPQTADDMPGMWRRYYKRWKSATRECIDPGLIELDPALARYVPPAAVVDKSRYSAFSASDLLPFLTARKVDTLIISGSETDVCVVASVLDAVDLGFRTIVVRDAICSSSDAGHDALMTLYETRFSEQIEIADAAEIMALWNPSLAA